MAPIYGKIEKGVPFPAPKPPKPKRTRPELPFKDMEVGDSVLVTGTKYVYVYAWKYGKKLGRKFSYRKEGDGYRVWRTE